jgi:hypothetical protein
MFTSMDRPTTCRTSITRRVLSLAVILAISAIAALAAPNLSLTVAGAGTFTSLPVQTCSLFSPQFTNQTSWKGPAACVDTITIWVFNGGADPTDGSLVTVSNVFPVGSSKSGTVLAVGGFCAFGAGNCGSITTTSNGWNCGAAQGSSSCTRSDVLAPGQSYPPIVIKVLIEDAFDNHLTEYDDVATVSGGGSGSSTKFTDFSDAISFAGQIPGYVEVVVHTVPEGLTLSVDGVEVNTDTTGHAFSWQVGSIHTILTSDPTGVLVNPGYTAAGSSIGGLATNLFVPTPPPFILWITAPDYQVTGSFRDQFTAIFTKP